MWQQNFDFFTSYNFKSIGLRYFNVFGPRQNPNSVYSAVIPKFINLIINNESPVINGDGNYSRDFTYVKNAVKIVPTNLLHLIMTFLKYRAMDEDKNH